MRNSSPVESAADFPVYCKDCGRRLLVEQRPDGFDAVTGALRLRAYAVCRGAWWERLFGGDEYHDSYVVSPRPTVL